MFKKSHIMYIYSITPVHVGSGTNINTHIDQPIQREVHTNLPIIQASSIKGVLRSLSTKIGFENNVDKIFGSPDKIGNLAFSDCKVLAFPVRLYEGVFGWVTSPFVLKRFAHETENQELYELIKDLKLEKNEAVFKDNNKESIEIEDFMFSFKRKDFAKFDKLVENISNFLPDNNSWEFIKERIKSNLIIVHDDIYKHITELYTEVIARIKIKDKAEGEEEGKEGTAENLWYEEYLPTDTILYSIVFRRQGMNGDEEKTVNSFLDELKGMSMIQIGGNESIGKGFVSVFLREFEKEQGENNA